MARTLNRLTALGVKRAGPGRHADGGGLFLSVDAAGRRRWLFLFTREGRRREMGLGSAREGGVTLAEARRAAAAARTVVAAGGDPIAERDRTDLGRPTFGTVADELLDSIEGGFRNAKHAAQWRTSLGRVPYDLSKVRIDPAAHERHVKALAALRARPVDLIGADDVLAVLTPLWAAAPETAARVRGRIERALDAAAARGLRTGPNPARWKGGLSTLLPTRSKLSKRHHAAMRFVEVPGFVGELRVREATAARALEFAILTASRSGEVLGMTWSEVDLDAGLWTVPAARMKAGREHRVPLVGRAIEILRAQREARETDDPTAYIFGGERAGRPLSGMSMTMLLRRMGKVGITVHGFRSSFRDWAGEMTDHPREVAEAALAHAVGDATERAYRRGDALAKRRKLMADWAEFVGSVAA